MLSKKLMVWIWASSLYIGYMQDYWVQYKLHQIHPKYITVDIFDTLLYRRPEPEFYRFYKLSILYCKELKKYGFYVTPYFLYLQRRYFTATLREENAKQGHDYETAYHEIFSQILDDLVRRQDISLSTKAKQGVITKLIDIEIEFELSQLKPNHRLIRLLEKYSKANTKIYYVSDMYLNAKQIDLLLNRLDVQLTAGGISSADHLVGKSSGRVFEKLQDKYRSIDLTQSVHIGDKHRSDVRVPKQFGLQTIWYFASVHRLILFVYNIVFKLYFKYLVISKNRSLKKQQSSILNTLFSDGPMNTRNEAEYIGWLFAPAIIRYLHQLGTRSHITGSKVVFITSESQQLSSFYSKLGFGNYQTLPNYNRTKLIRAYAHILTQKGHQLDSIVGLTKKILRRKSSIRALTTLGVVMPKSNQFLILDKYNLRRDKINLLDTNAAKKLWKSSYDEVLNSWNSVATTSKNTPIILADIGWNDTIQILLSEILLESDKHTNNISGIYLGRTGTNIFHPEIITQSNGIIFDSLHQKDSKYLYQPEVWESFINLDNANNSTRDSILRGVDQAIGYFKLSPQTTELFWSNNKSKLLKVLRHPTRRMIEVMSNLQFDYGTIDEPICPLVNVSARRIQAIRWLIFDRARFKSFYFHQGWKWGAATYYHFRIAYRIWRIKSRKPSF